MRQLRLLISLPVRLDQIQDLLPAAAPSLAKLMRRGSALEEEASVAGIACAGLGIAKQRDWPLAPLTARADGLDAGGGYWLRADPVHLEAGMGGLMLRPAQDLVMSEPEAADLAAAINDAWREAGLVLLTPHPRRWYLRLPSSPDLVTTPPDLAVGEYLTPHLPRGADAPALLRLVNEAQMVLHEHPVNVAREKAGRLPVNGLWLWGGGVAAVPVPEVDLLATEMDDLAALAELAGVALSPLPALYRELQATAHRDVLATLAPGSGDHDLQGFLARLERDWLRPLARDLGLGRIRQVRLHLLGRPASNHAIHTAQFWRFWR